MSQLTAPQTLDLLKQVVAIKGEGYIYPESEKEAPDGSCRYVLPNGSPSCIVGYVLDLVGLDLAELFPDFDYNTLPVTMVAKRTEVGSMFDEKALEVLTGAQDYQDLEYTWGESLARAAELVQD
jgi:hypothetical protein